MVVAESSDLVGYDGHAVWSPAQRHLRRPVSSQSKHSQGSKSPGPHPFLRYMNLLALKPYVPYVSFSEFAVVITITEICFVTLGSFAASLPPCCNQHCYTWRQPRLRVNCLGAHVNRVQLQCLYTFVQTMPVRHHNVMKSRHYIKGPTSSSTA